MVRIIFTYGLISGVIIIIGILASMYLSGANHDEGSVWLGYLIMLVALSAILVGVKQHRDQALGGVIRFLPALGLGLGIALVASLAYVTIWEVYLYFTHYDFMDKYTAKMLANEQAAGLTGAALAKFATEMAKMREAYTHPLYRFGMAFIEIFPVGFVVALISAALVRFPKFLPARSRAVAG
ncbi:DUF4199 domain-containing protein [soil metagenome]